MSESIFENSCIIRDPLGDQPSQSIRQGANVSPRLDGNPQPSVPEVARNTNQGVEKLYLHFPDLCHQVAANHSAYRHQRSIARMEEKWKFKMNEFLHNS
jgi:hypothetical protein